MGPDEFSDEERSSISESIRKKYQKVAASPQGHFRFPTGQAGLEALGYDPDLVARLKPVVRAHYCGVGNPFGLGPLEPGESVLDIGCGAGVDTFVAGLLVGPRGRSVGVDLSADMIARARNNLAAMEMDNVEFHQGSAEEPAFPDESFDVVISNAALNLVPDKKLALAHAYRVLKPGGRLMVADQVLDAPLAMDRREVIACWFR